MSGGKANGSLATMRLDKWLWAARWFRTRAVAAEAIEGGHVQVNGSRAKRAKLIRIGDDLRIRRRPFEYRISVTQLRDRRAPAAVAMTMYTEHPDSVELRARLEGQLRAQPATVTYEGKGRPTKRDRRRIEQFKRGA